MNKNLFHQAAGGHRRTWIWAVPFLVFGLFIAGQLLVLLPAKHLGLISRETVETYPTVLYLVIGTFSVVALIFALWIRVFERRGLDSAGVVFGGKGTTYYLRGYVVGLLMGAAVVVCVRLLGGYGLEADTRLQWTDLVPIVIMMLAFILQSGTEEFVFRGWMMGRLSERFGIWVGVVGNSLLFTLMHVEWGVLATTPPVMSLIFTSATLLFSLFLSLLVVRERSIWGAAAWHAAWNWIFITWFGLPTTGIELKLTPLITDLMPISGSPEWLTGGGAGPEGSFMTPVVLAIGCLVLLLRKTK